MADAVETPAERGFEAAGPDRARGRQAPRSRDPACRPEAPDAVAARRFRVAAPDSGQPFLALHATLAVRRPRDARRRDPAGQGADPALVDVEAGSDAAAVRSDERPGGTECVSTCRSRWAPDH